MSIGVEKLHAETQAGLAVDGTIALPEGGQTADMLSDRARLPSRLRAGLVECKNTTSTLETRLSLRVGTVKPNPADSRSRSRIQLRRRSAYPLKVDSGRLLRATAVFPRTA